MKAILLLAAIHILIAHQSQKKNNKSATPQQKESEKVPEKSSSTIAFALLGQSGTGGEYDITSRALFNNAMRVKKSVPCVKF